MKILIGTSEVCGMIINYKKGFEALGHEVTTFTASKNSFYNYQYDYVLDDTSFRYKIIPNLPDFNFLKRVFIKLKNEITKIKFMRFIKSLIDKNDILIYIWSSYSKNHKDLKYAKQKGKKIIHIFVGSEVRYFNAFEQQFGLRGWVFPNEYVNEQLDVKIKYIRYAEKYSTLIYSVPDQAGLQLRPYYHFQLPIDIQRFKFKNNKRAIPKIIHAPSVPYKKGTDFIEETVKRLSEEGLVFEFVSIRNLSNDKIPELLTDADILVDELIYHGPGMLSFEAMLSGCAVATKYFNNSPSCFTPPVVSIDRENIYEKLKFLITDLPFRTKLIEQGRMYAVKNNDNNIVVENLLKDLEFHRAFDYYPDFLRNKYKSNNKKNIKLLNYYTVFVENCDWYKKFVKNEKSGELNF